MKIFLFGNSGSGKTTILNRLSQLTNFETLEIDQFRRDVSDGTKKGEMTARDLFFKGIIPEKDQIIECTGTGETGRVMVDLLADTGEQVFCVTLLVPAAICKDRIKYRDDNVPFPVPADEIDSFVDRVQTEIQNGFISQQWSKRDRTVICYENNFDGDDCNKIVSLIMSLASDNGTHAYLNTAGVSRAKMLSPQIQAYYSEDYEVFQKEVVERNEKLAADRSMIIEFISNVDIKGNLVDIGCGAAQWYEFIKERVNNYYAIDANENAILKLSKHVGIKAILADAFDFEFSPANFDNETLDLGLMSFFISHFSDADLNMLLSRVKHIRNLIIFDSYWTSPLKDKHLVKDLKEVRRNTKSRQRIPMPKRFFEFEDLVRLFTSFDYRIVSFKSGYYWFCCYLQSD